MSASKEAVPQPSVTRKKKVKYNLGPVDPARGVILPAGVKTPFPSIANSGLSRVVPPKK